MRLVERVLEGEGAEPGAVVELVIVSDRRIAELNKRFLGRLGPTDVLAFPSDPRGWPPGEPRSLGEVVVSAERAVEQAEERGIAVEQEIERLVAHGVLHLLGYDDSTAAQRRRMRRLENKYMALASKGGES